jgi:hypothetical protein
LLVARLEKRSLAKLPDFANHHALFSLNMGRPITLSMIFLVFAGGLWVAANDLTEQSAKPLWTLDLHANGYSSGPYKVHSAPTAMRQIAFGSQGELVVINDGGICGKSNPVTAFVIDTNSGKLLKKANWVSNCWPYIFATAQGHYAVVTNTGMAVYSQGLADVITSRSDAAAERGSSDGRVLGAWKQLPGQAVNYLIDADTLRSTGTEVANRNVDAVSANSMAYVVSRMGSPNQVLILTDGKSTQLEYETKCGLVQTQFVSSDVLAIFGCNRITVINAAGVELFSDQNVGYPGSSRIAAASRNGKRFAFRQAVEKSSGDGPDKIVAERITVFDIEGRKAVFRVNIERLCGFASPAHASGIALSPAGTLLAIDSEGVTEVFRVP